MTTVTDADRRDQLAERLFEQLFGTIELLCVRLGADLGLYDSLHTDGPATSADLAERTGTAERYAREWLEQQAAAGIIDCDDPSAEPRQRRFTLPPSSAEVLCDPDNPAYLAAAGHVGLSIGAVFDDLVQAFRTGGGVPYAAYGARIVDAVAGLNRPMYRNDLVATWLPASPAVHQRLEQGGEVLDLGCGSGWSAISLAQGYPHARVLGIDLDQTSVDAARKNAADEGVAERVRFEHANAAAIEATGQRFDLVTIFEALHDMARPVEILRQARGLLSEGGSVIVGDEGVGDEFTAPADQIDRLNYAFSVLHCLPATMAEGPDEGIEGGTVIRADTVRRYAAEAGFSTCEVLPIDHDLWRFYRLVP